MTLTEHYEKSKSLGSGERVLKLPEPESERNWQQAPPGVAAASFDSTRESQHVQTLQTCSLAETIWSTFKWLMWVFHLPNLVQCSCCWVARQQHIAHFACPRLLSHLELCAWPMLLLRSKKPALWKLCTLSTIYLSQSSAEHSWLVHQEYVLRWGPNCCQGPPWIFAPSLIALGLSKASARHACIVVQGCSRHCPDADWRSLLATMWAILFLVC